MSDVDVPITSWSQRFEMANGGYVLENPPYPGVSMCRPVDVWARRVEFVRSPWRGSRCHG